MEWSSDCIRIRINWCREEKVKREFCRSPPGLLYMGMDGVDKN